METILTCIKRALRGVFVSGFALLVSVGLIGFPLFLAHAQETAEPAPMAEEASVAEAEEKTQDTYALGKVLSIVEEGVDTAAGMEDAYQIVLVKVVSGEGAGEVETIEFRSSAIGFAHVRLEEGATVILVHMNDARGSSYYILDQFRLPVVIGLALFFALLAIVLGKWKGVMSLLGLGVSLIVLTSFVVPQILHGGNPIFISATGAVVIAMSSLFLAHGFTKRTTLAFTATMFVLALAFGLAYLSILWSKLSGASSEEAIFLQIGFLQDLDLRGLLLGGLVIGALGVLDDVTTAQVATVEEIARANRSLDMRELYTRGISVGKEHIASLVNTLALAYVGAAFPLFLLFSLPDNPPLWVILNGESITEEMLRALIGGSALMLAVPVSTFLAAWAFGKGWIKIKEEKGHRHTHAH